MSSASRLDVRRTVAGMSARNSCVHDMVGQRGAGGKHELLLKYAQNGTELFFHAFH